jgi:hypothetical protein
MAKRKPQNDQRANLRGKGFVALPHVLLDSPAWRRLSPRARAVLIELLKDHNGYNNGNIGKSYREIGKAIGTSNFRTIANAITELVKYGFVAIEADALVWERHAREYRITFLPTGQPPHRKPPTDDWRAFSGDTAVSADDGQSAVPASAGKKKFDVAASARIAKKRQFSVEASKSTAVAVSSNICKPYPPAQSGRDNGGGNSAELCTNPALSQEQQDRRAAIGIAIAHRDEDEFAARIGIRLPRLQAIARNGGTTPQELAALIEASRGGA